MDVHSIFYTVQGEGPYSGVPALFIRLAGCNLRCAGCDTEYTQGRDTMSVNAIMERAAELVPESATGQRPNLFVITGGEPLRQNISFLLHTILKQPGCMVQIETNGTYAPPADFPERGVRVVCSPKAGAVAPALLPFISAYKYVGWVGTFSPVDGLPTGVLGRKGVAPARPHAGYTGPIYLSPMDQGPGMEMHNEANRQAVVENCMLHNYIVCLQVHKIIRKP